MESVGLEEGAKNFLAKGGMTEGQIHRLKSILTGTITAGEVAE